VEASKAEPNKALLAYVLEAVLTLAHPFAPFVTETIWQTLAWEADSLLAARTSVKIIPSDQKQADAFTEIQNIVSEVRFISKALKVAGLTLYYTDVPFLGENEATIKLLAHLKAVSEVRDGTGLFLTSTRYRCWLDIDPDTARSYQKELNDKQSKQTALIKQLETRLSNKDYVQNAPHEVVSQTKDQLAEAKQQLEILAQEAERFSLAS